MSAPGSLILPVPLAEAPAMTLPVRLPAVLEKSLMASVLIVGLALPGLAKSAGAWQFELTPYLWGATIGGDLAASDGTPISVPAPGDSSFFSLDNLEGAAFLAFEARRDQWRLLFDALYVDFADDVRTGPLLKVSERVTGYVFEAAAGYQLASAPAWEIIAGARYFQIENDLELQPGPRARTQKSWTDPFIGARFQHALTDRWRLRARADLGGFVSAELMQNYAFEIDYRIARQASVRLGYRYLATDFEKGPFLFDISVKGPTLGVAINF
jgi:hypothetical protein